MQHGHVSKPFVLQPEMLAYAGKSFMVHINAARNWNPVLEDASNDSTPTSHSSLNSSTKGCRYTSIAIPGEVGPGITSDKIKEDLFLHIQGGRLYGTNTTGHVLCMVLMFPYGLNPSVANPSLTLWGVRCELYMLIIKFFPNFRISGMPHYPVICLTSSMPFHISG